VGDIEPAFQVATQQDSQALLILASPLIGGNPKPLAELALWHRTEFARHGGLMAYGPNLQSFVRQQGLLAATVLLGSQPAQTPIETPAKFEFVVNCRTVGSSVSQSQHQYCCELTR
jgi:putative ABC transport system substrate-binding protein